MFLRYRDIIYYSLNYMLIISSNILKKPKCASILKGLLIKKKKEEKNKN